MERAQKILLTTQLTTAGGKNDLEERGVHRQTWFEENSTVYLLIRYDENWTFQKLLYGDYPGSSCLAHLKADDDMFYLILITERSVYQQQSMDGVDNTHIRTMP